MIQDDKLSDLWYKLPINGCRLENGPKSLYIKKDVRRPSGKRQELQQTDGEPIEVKYNEI